MEDVTVDVGKPLNAKSMKSMGLIDKVRVKPTKDTSWKALKDQRGISNDQPPNFKKRKREPSEKKKKKSLKLGESSATQKKRVPLSSSAPSKSPILEAPNVSDIPDPTSPTHTELQATAESEKTQSIPEPSETIPSPSEPIYEPSETIHRPSDPTPQTSEPNLTLPTLDEEFSKFSENSASRLKHLSDESRVSDNPSEVRTHWNRFIKWMTSEVFKLRGLSEQFGNDYIRSAKEKLEARLAQEDAEREKREAEERANPKAAAREAAEKASAEAATREQAEAEATLTIEATQKTVEDAEKTTEVALTRGESSASDLAPLVLKTLEELQKEQQLVRTTLNQHDKVNSSIQNLLAQLLQRTPHPLNP
ncbi:uncharacterized protein LOC127095284 [Lathyrus oleraceus]|uniref:uncharacterized protein LOC127095284 n=1 Tax=Pisum sativum TaxID=3888 RepID=UPI0021D197B3|nr:uncharacterized protein LOC127095284 [Pisum sativum]